MRRIKESQVATVADPAFHKPVALVRLKPPGLNAGRAA